MNKINHTTAEWFKNFLDEGQNPVDFFEAKFKTNTMGAFRVPASTAARFNWATQKNMVFDRIAQIYIEAIVKLKYTKLKKIPFNWLEEGDQLQLVNVVCEAVQHAVLNGNIWQRLNGSNVAVSSFTFNVDNTPWLMTSDMIGMIGWTLLINSEIDEYDVVSKKDLQLFMDTGNGNYKIVGKFSDLDDVAELK